MIQKSVYRSAFQPAAVDDHAVGSRRNVAAHCLQVICDSFNTVSFLHFQFRCITDDGCALCYGSHDCDDGNLINESRDDISFDDSTV